MSSTFLPINENGFLQKNATCLFSVSLKDFNLAISLSFQQTEEESWKLKGLATLSNHQHYKQTIAARPLFPGKFVNIGSWKLHIDYFGVNINLDPAIPEDKLGPLANRKLIEISLIPNGVLIKSDCMEGTIRLNG
ncbi:MAG: hypothetical protein WC371_02690 [Parachlamydiales bacterium]|jgi:hypothetical protein